MTNLPKREQRVFDLLTRLTNIWPDSLWLWSANGNLYLMRTGRDGERVMTSFGSVDDTYVVDVFNIPSDGGAW